MKVKEFIEKLSQLNPEGDIYINNGASYSDIQIKQFSKAFLDLDNALDMYYLQAGERSSDFE